MVVRVRQALRRWTEGASYIRQGGHQVGPHSSCYQLCNSVTTKKCSFNIPTSEWRKSEKLSFTHVKFSRLSVDVAETSLYGDGIDSELRLFQHFVDSRLRAVDVLKVEVGRPHVHTLLLLTAHQSDNYRCATDHTQNQVSTSGPWPDLTHTPLTGDLAWRGHWTFWKSNMLQGVPTLFNRLIQQRQ